MFVVNSRAVALLMTGFARRHKTAGRNWARVINISTDGASGYPNEISYWASTHAIESFSRAAVIELGPHGITVNLVSPGPVRTSWIGPDLEARVSREMPPAQGGTAGGGRRRDCILRLAAGLLDHRAVTLRRRQQANPPRNGPDWRIHDVLPLDLLYPCRCQPPNDKTYPTEKESQ